MKPEPLQPRSLKHRSHYKVYVLASAIISSMLLSFWGMKFSSDGWSPVWGVYSFELILSLVYFFSMAFGYYFWKISKLNRIIRVHSDHLDLHQGREKETILFSEIESVTIVCWSLFYVKTKKGTKYYFNSSIDRVDYVWEGVFRARPDLIDEKTYEDFRVRLVQYDHHQKRKEWFFRHRLLDVINWIIAPVLFIFFAYLIQSQTVMIHQPALYFFRLFMYSMLTMICVAFFYSFVLKKLVFDKKITANIKSQDKSRDLEFEGIILQRSKMFQLITVGFIMATLIKWEVNLYSVTKVKSDITSFNFKKGNTLLVDNRYNCIGCPYSVADGDYIIFGRGVIGQVLAGEGERVGLVSEDRKGRVIASESIHEVPPGHLAVKTSNKSQIVFVKVQDLIGKIQN